MRDAGEAALDKGAITSWIDRLYRDTEGSVIAAGREFVLWDRTADGVAHIEWLDTEGKATRRSYAFAGGAATGGTHNAYYHVCLHGWKEVELSMAETGKTASRKYNRGRRDSATVFPAAWIEVDYYAGDGHKHTKLPHDQRAALQLVLDAVPGLPPSAVIDSGGGIHVYWILEEPWLLANAEDRQRAFSINYRLSQLVKAEAHKNHWTVDTVHDLARVLRLPGTLNYKYDPPRPVTLLTLNGLAEDTYTVDALEEHLPAEEAASAPLFNATGVASETAGMTFVVNFQATPPPQFVEYLAMEADITLQQTWQRTRNVGDKDGDLSADTASEYTLSLVSRVCNLWSRWTDQELADLIMSWRIKHGELLKSGRPMSEANLRNKIVRTVQKVRSGFQDDEAVEAFESLQVAVNDPSQSLTGNADVLSNLSKSLGMPVQGVEVIRSESGGVYVLIMPEGRIELGGASSILDARKFRERVFDLTGRLIRRYKGQAWDPLAISIRLVAEEVDIPTELDAELETLVAYCQHSGIFGDIAEAANHGTPYWRPSDKRLGIFVSPYLRWRLTCGTRFPSNVRALFAKLRACGLGESYRQSVAGTTVHVFLTTPETTEAVRARCAAALSSEEA